MTTLLTSGSLATPARADTLSCSVPEGFEPLRVSTGFIPSCGGFFLHRERPVLAVRVQPEHLNVLGIAHGGFLATFADTAFGAIIRRETNCMATPTVHLGVDYIAAVRPGTWLEAHVTLVKAGRRLTNATCVATANGRTILHANGVFYMGAPHQAALASTDA
ncbi:MULTISPECIES: PaaI family thioesterase [unclassified Paraburkholderia]|uniref:PaaI family thioesterase n=1 Tax=unclassified Paraburkholderia TaxID=2615204 RepID=UPI002AB6D241|nr:MULTISPECIES: PaaI family thioesterase [unclassified Paraburkholderia]